MYELCTDIKFCDIKFFTGLYYHREYRSVNPFYFSKTLVYQIFVNARGIVEIIENDERAERMKRVSVYFRINIFLFLIDDYPLNTEIRREDSARASVDHRASLCAKKSDFSGKGGKKKFTTGFVVSWLAYLFLVLYFVGSNVAESLMNR